VPRRLSVANDSPAPYNHHNEADHDPK
jgi:hypothetical protein